jgi:hypothetical protein
VQIRMESLSMEVSNHTFHSTYPSLYTSHSLGNELIKNSCYRYNVGIHLGICHKCYWFHFYTNLRHNNSCSKNYLSICQTCRNIHSYICHNSIYLSIHHNYPSKTCKYWLFNCSIVLVHHYNCPNTDLIGNHKYLKNLLMKNYNYSKDSSNLDSSPH